jgi:exodeoxyribonuclease VII small subunit
MSKTFTDSLKSLQQAADQIGKPATSLEDALKLFDQGMEESEYLTRILEEAEQKIEVMEQKEDSSNE